MIPHPHHLRALAHVDPRLVEHALVTGDPCLDRIEANAFQRARYRRAYRATGTVVLIASTWGPNSLFGRHPDLPERVVTELDADRHRVILTLHPNVWARHGRLQVESWLSAARTAGLVVVPPNGEWRPALIAADAVISDHGSITCYAAATGTPTIMASDGGAEVVDDSPLADLRDALPHLDHAAPITLPTIPTKADIFTAAAQSLLTRCYDILALPRPAIPTPALPPPNPEIPTPPHFRVTIDHVRETRDRTILTVTRRTSTWDDGLLVAADHHPDFGVLERASAIWSTDAPPQTLLRAFPGARLALTGHTAVLRDGTHLAIDGDLTDAHACAAVLWWATSAQRPATVEIDGAGALRIRQPA